MRLYNRVWMKRKKNWNQMQWTTETNFAIRTRWRTAAASSSSCSIKNVATHYTAAGRYRRIHTRTSCRSVQYNNYNLSGPGTLWNRARCLRNRQTTVIPTQSSSSGSNTMYRSIHIKPTSRLLRRHLNHHRSSYIFLHWYKKKGNVKKKNRYWIRTSDAEVKGQQRICSPTRVRTWQFIRLIYFYTYE